MHQPGVSQKQATRRAVVQPATLTTSASIYLLAELALAKELNAESVPPLS